MNVVVAIQFNDTITLGGAIIIAIATVFGLYRVALGVRMRNTNEIQGKLIVALETDADHKDDVIARQEKRLNELGAEKDAALTAHAACESQITALQDQLSKVPAYAEFMEFGKSMMEHVDRAAAERQEAFTKTVVDELKAHDTRMQAAADATLGALHEIVHTLKETQ